MLLDLDVTVKDWVLFLRSVNADMFVEVDRPG